MNPKYTFIYECHYPGQSPVRQTMEFEAETLPDILDQFERFLLGAGFVFKGPIEVNEDDSHLIEPMTVEEVEEEEVMDAETGEYGTFRPAARYA